MPNPNASSPAGLQVLTLFQEELARAGALPGLAPAGPALWPRFAGYYQGLTRLPRRLRRALQRRWRRSLGGIALLCALGQAPAFAATINVGGACTLVDAANNDALTGGCTAGSAADTIELPFFGSTHTLTTVDNNTEGPTGLPVITSEITISGGIIDSTITRDSSAPLFRILAVAATGNLTLRHTTVSGGLLDISVQPFGNGQGGGIFNRGILTLVDSTVSGNSAFVSGGGIDNVGNLTLTSSTVLGNSAGSFGGGISNIGTLTLESGTVSGTATAGYGSSISNSGGTLTVTNSTISGNTGGGISNDNRTIDGTLVDGTLSLTNSTVSGNTGGARGGGIDNSGILTVTNSTVSGNTTSDSGGGIRNGGTVSLTNSTVEANSAQSRGGGIYNFPGYDYAGIRYSNVLTLTNSTVSGNTGGPSGGGVSNGDLLTLTNSTVSGNTAADRGGGVDNAGTVTFANSTVTANAAGSVAGGLLNTGAP